MVLEGDDAIATARRMMGKTNPLEADPGTIRADYAIHTNRNVIHGSDSPESADGKFSCFCTGRNFKLSKSSRHLDLA